MATRAIETEHARRLSLPSWEQQFPAISKAEPDCSVPPSWTLSTFQSIGLQGGQVQQIQVLDAIDVSISTTPPSSSNGTPVSYDSFLPEQFDVGLEESNERLSIVRDRQSQQRAVRIRNIIGICCLVFVGIILIGNALVFGVSTLTAILS